MARLPPRYNLGTELKNDNPTLYNQLTDIYTNTANIVNTKVTKYSTTTNPPANDQINRIFDIGDIWVNTSTNAPFIMTSRTSDVAVTWTAI